MPGSPPSDADGAPINDPGDDGRPGADEPAVVADAVAVPPAEPPALESGSAGGEGLTPAIAEAAAPEQVPEEEVASPPVEVADLPILTLEDDGALQQRLADADPDAGWRFTQRCVACHSLSVEDPGPGAAELGPRLAPVFGGAIGAIDAFAYSPVFVALSEAGAVWNAARLDAFLAAPDVAIPGTAMAFPGIDDPGDRANVIAFLAELADIWTTAEEVTETADVADLMAAADVDRGALIAARSCGGCHAFDLNGAALVGPNLFDVVGRTVGGMAEFLYSPAMMALNAEGAVWTYAFLDAFLASPASAVPGTRMGMTGVRDAEDRAAIIAYLRQLSPNPMPLGVAIGFPQPGLAPVVFSDDQANQGIAVYEAFGCGNCHGQDLRGDIDIGGFGDAPPLTGQGFQRRWFGQNLGALFAFLEEEKAPIAPDGMNPNAIIALMAFILAENGFQAGLEPLPDDLSLLRAMGFFQ